MLMTLGLADSQCPDKTLNEALIDILLEMLDAFAARGTDGLLDTHAYLICHVLSLLKESRALPSFEPKIRTRAETLQFCLENSIDGMRDTGTATGAYATQICEHPHPPPTPASLLA